MKATFEFNLPEEQEEYNIALQAAHLARVIDELDSLLRNKIKYTPELQHQERTDTYQEIREALWELRNNK